MHVAIIMDGNGRWAARRHLPRSVGHRAGARAVNAIVEAAARQGIKTLTLYAFSADNWQRPTAEVSALFALFGQHLSTQTQRCLEQSIRLNVIGRRDRLRTGLRELIEHSERATAHCKGMLLRIAVDYSSQHSLAEACRRAHAERAANASRFAELLGAVDHAIAPAAGVDLLIRTGGEQRLSDFLLWECAYAELLFVERLWPDFDAADFSSALTVFSRRDRRFGRLIDGAPASAKHG